ncbi:MAG: ATP-binding cassette domain-containing protein [Candidatus Levybacteria bacterium]|nr:ATP-binding cassette domain-containing protein [Candidatus Levybacteria bacterium]
MISLENVSKKFGTGVFAISDISLTVERGEFVFLVGPTGSGKTTIFRLLIREIIPTQGSVVVNSFDVIKLPNKKVPDLRKMIGVIFQDLKLLHDRTIIENTILPLEVSGVKRKEAAARAEEVLSQLGILEHKDKFPVQLSGGEIQRAAIARALTLSPQILLADEPTGNLDDETSWEIVKLLSDINEKGTTVIMATHNADIVKRLNKRIIELKAGTVVNDRKGHKVNHKSSEKDEKEKPAVTEESRKSTETSSFAKASADKQNREQSETDPKKEEHLREKDKKAEDITSDFEEALK